MSLWRFFLVILRFNAVTFGGGYTIIPLLKQYFVENKKVLEEDEVLKLTTLAQSGPGVMVVSASLLLGYRLFGIKGALVGIMGAVLPPLVIISIISLFYQQFRSNLWVSAALAGIGGTGVSNLFITVFNKAINALKTNPVFSGLMMTASFAAGLLTDIRTSVIIFSVGLLSLILFSFYKEEQIP